MKYRLLSCHIKWHGFVTFIRQESRTRTAYLYSARTANLGLLPTRFDFLPIANLGALENEMDFVDQSSRGLSWDPPPTPKPKENTNSHHFLLLYYNSTSILMIKIFKTLQDNNTPYKIIISSQKRRKKLSIINVRIVSNESRKILLCFLRK